MPSAAISAATTPASLVQTVIAEATANPVDLLEEGAAGSDTERDYLQALSHMYVRTMQDLWNVAAASPCPRILEVGSLYGVTSIAMSHLGARVTAADLPAWQGQPALQRRFADAGVTAASIDLRDPLPFADASFDLVVCCETLEHLPFNPVPVLREFRRVLAPGGLLYLAVPNQAQWSNRLRLATGRSIQGNAADMLQRAADGTDVATHWREWVASDARHLLVATGFAVTDLQLHDWSVLPGRARRWSLRRSLCRVFPRLRETIVVQARATA